MDKQINNNAGSVKVQSSVGKARLAHDKLYQPRFGTTSAAR